MAQENEFEYFDSINKFANENQSIKRKQSSIKWLHHLYKEGILIEKSFEIAKEMEKRQIMDAYENGVSDENESNLSGLFTNAEQYYNETYSNGKKN